MTLRKLFGMAGSDFPPGVGRHTFLKRAYYDNPVGGIPPSDVSALIHEFIRCYLEGSYDVDPNLELEDAIHEFVDEYHNHCFE
jgi:hypothetical protein